MSAQDRTGHAIVLGASIAGLAAARVLSESFAKVTIFDRDELPTHPEPRRGVPQSAHSHGLLARGRQVLEELFEDFVPEMTALGAIPLDVQRDALWINDGVPMATADSGLLGLCVSRATLEFYVRCRVEEIANVEIRDRTEVLGLRSHQNRITGVTVLPIGGPSLELDADLVVDATGRGNRGPTWLAELGYDKPAEERVDPGTNYVSRDYRRRPGAPYAALIQSPWPQHPYGGVAIAVEGDRWMVTLIGVGPDAVPPADPGEFVAFTERLPSPILHDILAEAEPLGPPMKLRLPTSVRRRYEHLTRLPEGLVAIGDAVCAFNPAYGQGMTVALAEAMALRDCLRQGRAGLPKRYYKAIGKIIDVPWSIAVGADRRFDHVEGVRTRQAAFLNGYVARLHRAAAKHPSVGKAFLAVANLMAPPPSLFAPSVLAKALLSGGRTSAPATAFEQDRDLTPVA
jgi:2-polyprenyl-6-methoxyphenol hydroxylase-like FAD-dependent oxidoreductase